jgi:GNAT superfamily N-acetyltransferase
MPHGISVRTATPRDAEGVARVHVGTWQAAYRGLVPDEYLDALDVDDRIAAYGRFGTLNDPQRPMWVADVDGAIVGFVMVGPSDDEDGVGELLAIYVEADHWGSVVGVELMTRAIDWLSSRFAHATLWVLEGNERARRFYERGGWFFDGTRKEDDRGSFVLREVRYRIEL